MSPSDSEFRSLQCALGFSDTELSLFFGYSGKNGVRDVDNVMRGVSRKVTFSQAIDKMAARLAARKAAAAAAAAAKEAQKEAQKKAEEEAKIKECAAALALLSADRKKRGMSDKQLIDVLQAEVARLKAVAA
jgi:hypothetical protein